jgi:hypothetical protein
MNGKTHSVPLFAPSVTTQPSRAAVKETKKQMFPAIRKNEGSMIFIKIEVMYVCLSIGK